MSLKSTILSPYRNIPNYLYLWFTVLFASAMLILGYHHSDELGQITSFALYKLGLEPAEALPWEFGARIRSWFVPALYIPIIKLFNSLLGHFNYFAVERVMLLFDAMLWFLLLPLLSQLLKLPKEWRSIDRKQLLAIACCTLWWFLPSMMVRHSSEAIGMMFLVIYLFLMRPEEGQDEQAKIKAFGAGFVAALAFWARFQNAFFVAGFWLAQAATELKTRHRISSASWLVALGVIGAILAGIVFDSWGYGQFTVSFYNYFTQNIVNDVASLFGKKSPFFYFYQGMGLTLNPLIIIWLPLAAYYGWKNQYLRNITVGLFLFLFVHVAVPHKEVRFLLPMVFPAMLLLLAMVSQEPWKTMPCKWRWLFNSRYLKVVLVANIMAMIGFTAVGLTKDRVRTDKAVFDLAKSLDTEVHLYTNYNIYGAACPSEAGYEARFKCTAGCTPYIDEINGDFVCDDFRCQYGLPFAKPAQVKTIFMARAELLSACDSDPAGYLLVTKYDSQLIDQPYAGTIASFPPQFLLAGNFFWKEMKWWKRMWRYQLVKCGNLGQVNQ